MYIGVISDTHGSFDDRVKKFLDPVDVIWHAGDFGGIVVAEKIAAFKPLIGVSGNCDGMDVRVSYPETQLFKTEGVVVAMKHIGGYPEHYDYTARRLIERTLPEIFVCGHSHILRVMNDAKYNMLMINPGACGHQGIHQTLTAVRFHIDDCRIHDMEVGEWNRINQTIQ
ncbi:MAG: metallophosphoesterase family protein [Bacteroidales bacterium]|nr:metallophosphoesterase family protein [Bacteroidales bacterium]